MADPRFMLDLYDQDTSTPDELSALLQTGGFGDQGGYGSPVNLMGATEELPQLPWQQQQSNTAPQGNIMQRIQELVGARELDQGGTIADILSARFPDAGGTTIGDYAQGVVQSALGKPTLGPQIAESRMSGLMKQMESIANLEALSARAALYKRGGTGSNGATMQIIQGLMAADPNLTFEQALYKYQAGNRQGTTLTPSGVQVIPGAPEAAGIMASGKTTGTETAKINVERQAGLAKAQSALNGFKMQTKVVTNNIDKALATISPWSTDYGIVFQSLPNTEARKLNNYLTTIKTNIGFDKLQQLRDNSPTGGALGQVSDFENRLLQAVNGALDPAQSDQLKENLEIIKDLYPKVLAERQTAFQHDYGAYLQTDQTEVSLEQEDPLGIR